MPSMPKRASCGCTPAVAHTSSNLWAVSMAARLSSRSVPTVMIPTTPASRARAIASAASEPRWQ